MGHGTFYMCNSKRKICLEQICRLIHVIVFVLYDHKDIQLLSGSFFELYRVCDNMSSWFIDTSCVLQHNILGNRSLWPHWCFFCSYCMYIKMNKHMRGSRQMHHVPQLCVLLIHLQCTLFCKWHSYLKIKVTFCIMRGS